MRVLVIGGSGLVGSLVLPYLARQHTVRVFDLVPPTSGVAVDYLAGDLRDTPALRTALDGIDALIYMAMGPGARWDDPDTARAHLDVAVGGLYVALQLARDAGTTHAVYTSSMSVYAGPGEPTSGRDRFPDESVPPDSTNAYGLAKRLGEEVCHNAVRAYDMSVVALRLCHPTADSEFPRTGRRVQRTICTSARDTGRALLAALDYQGHGFEAFGISGDAAERYVSIRKARDVLGWEPLDRTDRAS